MSQVKLWKSCLSALFIWPSGDILSDSSPPTASCTKVVPQWSCQKLATPLGKVVTYEFWGWWVAWYLQWIKKAETRGPWLIKSWMVGKWEEAVCTGTPVCSGSFSKSGRFVWPLWSVHVLAVWSPWALTLCGDPTSDGQGSLWQVASHVEDCPARITSWKECAGQRLAVLGEGPVFPRVMVVEVPILVGGGAGSLVRGHAVGLSVGEWGLECSWEEGPVRS